MWSYAFRRIILTIPTLLIVISVCYLLLHVTPGGPFDSERKVSEAVLAQLNAKYGLDLPLYEQYWMYIKGLLQGDLGASFRYADWSVNDLVAAALPISLLLGGSAMVFALIIGVVLGTIAALRQNSIIDYFVMMVGSLGLAFPSFVVGPILILIFALWIPLFPAGGWQDYQIQYMILPISLLTFINLATIGRVMRGSLIEVMNSNFIRTAKAKGLPMSTIVMRHAMKPALMPVISILGPIAIGTVSGAVVTESVFSLPGVGKLIINGASNRDYTLVLGLVVLVTVASVIINLLVDLTYALLDPKIRY